MTHAIDTSSRPNPGPARRRLLPAVLALALLAPLPTAADDPSSALDELKERFDRSWEELMGTLGPSLDRLARTLETIERIDSLENYEDPEILPNGDIILRRRADAPPLPDPAPETAPAPGVDPDDPGIPL